MTTNVVSISIAGESKQILIYESDIPLTFRNNVTHAIPGGTDGTIQLITVYTCEDKIYRTYEPTEDDPKWHYWFLILNAENTTIDFSNSLIQEMEALKQHQTETDTNVSALMGMASAVERGIKS